MIAANTPTSADLTDAANIGPRSLTNTTGGDRGQLEQEGLRRGTGATWGRQKKAPISARERRDHRSDGAT
jgi:hypothetical protein